MVGIISRMQRRARMPGLAGLAVMLCHACLGCGLLYLPRVERFPSQSLRRISVKDLEDRTPVTDATVSFTLARWDNWMKPCSSWGIAEDQTDDLIGGVAHGAEVVAMWDAVAEGPGVYAFESRARWVTEQIFFPIPSPLGGVLHHGHQGTITASAPAHRTVWVNHGIERHADRMAKAYWGRDREPPEAVCVEVDEDGVTVLLPRREHIQSTPSQ